jgi:adenylate kinase family enzyme
MAEMQNIVEMPFVLTLRCGEVASPLIQECMLKRLLERGKSSGRSDDNPESIKKRFKTANEETEPVLDIFRKQGKLVEVDSDRAIETIFEEISKHFEKV